MVIEFKLNKVLISFFIIILSVSYEIVAQENDMVTYTWDSYHVKFQIPKDLEIIKSDSKSFVAGNEDISLSIFPRLEENLTYDEMVEALKDWAYKSEVILTEDGIMSLDNLNGYWGVMADGTKDYWPIFLMLIVDPDYSNTSLYVWLSYREDKLQNASDIISSFTPN